MNKKCLLAFAFGLILSFSSFAQSDPNAQSESKGNLFFSVGVYNGFFSGGPIVPFSNFEIKKLFAATIGGYYELPLGPGNAFFGLDVGYSSGSKFGGKGDVDFIPIDLTAAFVYPLVNFFYIGPRLKLGALTMLGPDWNKVVFTAGARIDAELRSTGFPLGLYVAGGIDLFPTAPELAMLPVIEAGLRYPRGKFTWFGSSDTKNKEPAKTDTGSFKDDSSGLVALAPAPATPTPVVTDPVVPNPVAPTPNVPAPATPTPTTPTPVVPTPVTPAPNTPASVVPPPATPPPVVPDPLVPTPATPTPTTPVPPTPVTPAPVVPTPVAPAPVVPVPVTPTPVPLPPVTPVPAAPAPVTPAPVAPSPVVIAPAIPAPTAPVSVAPGTPGRNITLEDGRQGILNSIYFEPDTAVLIETYRPILESVGRQLAADPSLKLLLRAYAADFGTSDGRYIVSVDRARFSRDFFTGQYGISPSRFSIEAYGSDRTPIYATEDWESHRCVELIIFRD